MVDILCDFYLKFLNKIKEWKVLHTYEGQARYGEVQMIKSGVSELLPVLVRYAHARYVIRLPNTTKIISINSVEQELFRTISCRLS